MRPRQKKPKEFSYQRSPALQGRSLPALGSRALRPLGKPKEKTYQKRRKRAPSADGLRQQQTKTRPHRIATKMGTKKTGEPRGRQPAHRGR